MPEALIPIFLFASIAAVAIFRPLTKRIGVAFERAYEERTSAPNHQIERLTQLMERLVDRMDQLEDRLDFTERVLQRQRVASSLTTGRNRHHSEALADEGGGSVSRDTLSSL